MNTTIFLIILILIIFPLSILIQKYYNKRFGNLGGIVSIFIGMLTFSVLFFFFDPVRPEYTVIMFFLLSLIGLIRTLVAGGIIRSAILKKI